MRNSIRSAIYIAAAIAAPFTSPAVSLAEQRPAATAPIPVDPPTKPFAIFSAENYYHARDLYFTDGSKDGTKRIENLSDDITVPTYYLPLSLPGRVMITILQDSSYSKIGKGFLVVDGSGKKTFIKEKNISKSDYNTYLGKIRDKFYFSAIHDYSVLISTDGTQEGTKVVAKASCDAAFEFKNAIHCLSKFYGAVFKIDEVNATATQLFKIPFSEDSQYDTYSDVTGNSSPVVVLNDKFVFFQYTRRNGREPWVSDGTAEGTKMLKNILPFDGNGVLDEPLYVKLGDKAIFAAQGKSGAVDLWATDGTSEGTGLLKQTNKRTDRVAPIYQDGIVANGHLYFRTFDGPLSHASLWRTDGTPEGTEPVELKIKQQPLYLSNYKKSIILKGNDLYLSAHTISEKGGNGCGVDFCVRSDLYRHNIGKGITRKLAEVTDDGTLCELGITGQLVEGRGSEMTEIAPFGNGVIFAAIDQYGSSQKFSRDECERRIFNKNTEPWVYLPSEGVARKLREINPGGVRDGAPEEFGAPVQ